MHRLFVLCVLGAITVTIAFGQGEATGTSTITLGIGGGWPNGNQGGTRGGPVVDGTYEFRIGRYLAVETAVDNTLTTFDRSSSVVLPGTNLLSVGVPSRVNGRDTSVPVGFRGILPTKKGKVEFFATFDGGYMWNTNQYSQGWEVQGGLGARFAVDKSRHFWLGTSANYSHEFVSGTKNWISWTADLGFRFGH